MARRPARIVSPSQRGGLSERLFAWGCIGLVLLAPLPFGANRPAFWSLLALLVGLALVAWTIRQARHPTLPVAGWPNLRGPFILYGLALAWALLQTVPGGFGMPHSSWSLLETAGIAGGANTISAAPGMGWTGVMRLATYAALFWLVVQAFQTHERAHKALRAIALGTALYAFYGLWLHALGSETVIGFEKWAYRGSLTSTFVNRNTYATFAGLGLLASLGLAMRSVIRRGPAVDARGDGRHAADPALAFMAGLANATALMLSESRGGLLATLVGLVVFGVGLLLRLRNRRAALGAGAAGLVALAALLAFSGGDLADRFGRLRDTENETGQRLEAYRQVLAGIADRPLTGHGLGTFADTFRAYRPTDLKIYFDRAHNSYLELAFELGVPAALALVGAIGWAAALAWQGLRRRPRRFVPAWTGVAATALVGVHSLIDFSLQIPAVALLYACLIGLATAQALAPSAPDQAEPLQGAAGGWGTGGRVGAPTALRRNRDRVAAGTMPRSAGKASA